MQETTQITYGEGTVTVIMSTESGTEVAATDIRFGDYYKAMSACLTAKELEEVAEGKNAEINFRYIMTDELADEEAIQHFEAGKERAEMVTGPLESGVYFEVEAVKSIGGEEPSDITTLYDDVELQFEIPRYLIAEKRVYYAMTDVMGVCDLEEDVDEDADTLSVLTHNMGTTLILYQDGKDKSGHNGSGFAIKTQYLCIVGILALAFAWWTMDRRHKKKDDVF